MKVVLIILRLVVGGVFVYAGVAKILDPTTFATDVGNYRMLPHSLVNLVAVTLPWIELVAGLLLVLGIWVKASALVATMLLAVFLVAIAQAVGRGLDIRCGCFGTVEARKVGFTTLAADAVLLAMAVGLCKCAKEEK